MPRPTAQRTDGQGRALALSERVAMLEADADKEDDRMDRHEIVCGERYRGIDEAVVRVHNRIDRLLYFQVGAMISGILTLIAVLAQLLTHGHT